MKTHLVRSYCAVLAAAATMSLSAIAVSQEQTPANDGAAAQNSSQGTPSASGAAGQNSTGRSGQGASESAQGTRDSAQGTRGAQRDSGAQNRDNPSTQDNRRRQGGADAEPRDSRPDASDRPAIDRDTSDPSDRRTTNRLDADDDDRGADDRDTRGDRSATDRTRTDDRTDRTDRDPTDRDPSDRDPSDRDDSRTGDRGDRDDDRGGSRDRDIDFGARFDNDSSNRLVIRGLQSRGIFGRAGFRDGDVIISIRGQRIVSEPAFHRLLLAADGRVPVIVLRDGSEQTIYIDDLDRETRLRTPYGYDEELYQTDRAWLGVFLDTRYDNAVVVQAVQEGSAADEAGVRAGDRIMSINGRRVQTPSQLTRIIGGMEPGDRVEIDVARWQTRQVEAELGERPATSSRFRYLEDGGELRSGRTDAADREELRIDDGESRETFRVQP